MTKEDFKRKYHGKSVKIEPSMEIQHFGEMAERPRMIREMCKHMGLEAHRVTVPAPHLLIAIVDKTQSPYPYPYSYVTASEPVSEQEFLDDFKEAHEELEFGRAKKLLADFKIEYGEISKSSTTSKDVMSTGFFHSYTSNEASLWWHPNGERILFVRGEGAFSLTDKIEENA